VLARIGFAAGLDDEDRRRALARSFFISADMAHAYHPNFPAAYEPDHKVKVNGGPVIKTNANQRYATGAETAARFMAGLRSRRRALPAVRASRRPRLRQHHRPHRRARLGMATVDVGSPMWAMHSARESAGALDPAYMAAALQ
jgi:aspartyl aminopeptidase